MPRYDRADAGRNPIWTIWFSPFDRPTVRDGSVFAGRERSMNARDNPTTTDRTDRDLITEPSPSADWRTVYAALEVRL